MTQELTKRLRACVDKGRLSQSEVARWLKVPIPTLRTWLHDGRLPRDYRMDDIDQHLKLLEDTIKRGHLPMPPDTTQSQRLTYIEEQYDAANARGVSASSAG